MRTNLCKAEGRKAAQRLIEWRKEQGLPARPSTTAAADVVTKKAPATKRAKR